MLTTRVIVYFIKTFKLQH